MRNAWKTILVAILVMAIFAFCAACSYGKADVDYKSRDSKTSTESSATSETEGSDGADTTDKNQSSDSGEDQNDDPAYDDNWLPRA